MTTVTSEAVSEAPNYLLSRPLASIVAPPSVTTATAFALENGEPFTAAQPPTTRPQRTILDRRSSDASDVAKRVVLAAFADENWPQLVASDLHPNFAATLELTRTPATNEPDARPAEPVLVVLEVTQSAGDPAVWFVSFDEIIGLEEVRHVSTVTLTTTGPPLVLDIVQVA